MITHAKELEEIANSYLEQISDIEKTITTAIKNGWIKTESEILKAIETI